jgi:dihydroxyacetone kinase-like predicted kinase
LQAGLGALVAFDPRFALDENLEAMEDAVASVRAGSVALASRSATIGSVDVSEGQYLGLVEGQPVTAGDDLPSVAAEVVARLVGDAADVLTVFVGDGAGRADGLVETIRAAHPDLEIEVHDGGQPHYPLLFAVE